MSNSLQTHVLYSPWNSPGQNTGVEWVAFPFSRGSSQPRDQIQVFRIAGGFFFMYLFKLEANYFTILWWFLTSIDMNQSWVYMCSPSWDPLPPPSPSHPSGSSQCTRPEHPVSRIKPGLAICLHMIIYMFQCYSRKSSHPRLLPQRPKDCSIHLCLFCCFAYRVIVTIFLNSIYMC